MTKERRNEIAYLYLVNRVKKEGISNLKKNEVQEQIRNTAKKIGVTLREAQEFAHELVLPLVEAAFPMPACD